MVSTLILRHAAKAIRSGGIYWFRPEDAVALIVEAQVTGTPILGFDAARVGPAEDQIQPSFGDSWDYTTHNGAVPDPYAHATQFIKKRAAEGLCFEMVLGKTPSKKDQT